MKSTLSFISLDACALITTAGLSPAAAQNVQTPGIYRAQQDISVRIQQGIASGHLTPPEAQGLLRSHQEVQFRENQFKAKGWASEQERQHLRADLNTLGLEVERLMTNNDMVRTQGQSMGAGLHTPGIDRAQQDINARIQQGMESGHSMISNNDVVRSHASPANNLLARIDEGVRSGHINRQEARRLQERERQLQRNEDRAEADGVVTRHEAVRLDNGLRALTNDVERMMRNRR